ncbi:Uncharacterized protein Adt_45658 [Abeliophyllum distichum]|uniref:Uncharacterized protein n=1 Tax=Abeliophyllum distichum TaxID=126358 RepID=A0ABD1PEC6_9LAMI
MAGSQINHHKNRGQPPQCRSSPKNHRPFSSKIIPHSFKSAAHRGGGGERLPDLRAVPAGICAQRQPESARSSSRICAQIWLDLCADSGCLCAQIPAAAAAPRRSRRPWCCGGCRWCCGGFSIRPVVLWWLSSVFVVVYL